MIGKRFQGYRCESDIAMGPFKKKGISNDSHEWGSAGGYKPQHFPLPCHILAFFFQQPTTVRSSMPQNLSLLAIITFK